MLETALQERDATPWECEVDEPNEPNPFASRPDHGPTHRRGLLAVSEIPWEVGGIESLHLGDVRGRLTPRKALHLLGIFSLAELELPRAERELEQANQEVREASERAAALQAEVVALRDIRNRVNRTVDTSTLKA